MPGSNSNFQVFLGPAFGLRSKAILVNFLSRVFSPGKDYSVLKGLTYLRHRLIGGKKCDILNTDN